MPITTCVFDAYGTLFDVTAAARRAAEEPQHAMLAAHWPKLATDWRAKQLQYSWLRAVSGEYCDFWRVTEDALDWALEASGLLEDGALRARLLQLYWELDAYPEARALLQALKAAGLKTAILSNGSPRMLQAAVDSADIASLLDAQLSVESVGNFKPDRAVYQLVLDHFDVAADSVLFVSSNGWDVAGASGFGFQTVWVNRSGEPMDRLPHTPQFELANLSPIAKMITPNAQL
ncbi:haloacid dehalogenase type II [Cognatishimia sp. SS12]|uniref:haloacid dehalogenase type II n=1 Tax=Cognatishimia sp. SS12 TaxID=2979465 RepID=UPI00232BF51F|nr:haloacid dehalogenase type II [Cognatishimia sp. SS12]MDC0738763.1 haloacid dehalogenase type II [Cognatishimia sp. SS12]